MQTLLFTIQINSTAEKVWECLWQPENYKKWTGVFCEGSYYEAETFAKGGIIKFLTPNGEGMYGILEEIKPNQYLAIRHIGELFNFEETPPEKWTEAWETYELTSNSEGVELSVKVDSLEEYVNHMKASFTKGLQVLKLMAET